MDMSYQQHQSYQIYEHPQWSEEYKPTLSEHEQDHSRQGRSSTSMPTAEFGPHAHPHRPSMLKIEDDYSSEDHVWHERRHDSEISMRHYPQQNISVSHPQGQHQQFIRIDPNFAASYAQPPQWSLPQSGANTPTQVHSSIDSYGRPVVQYANYNNFGFGQDPMSAVSMSPQSSQGGWNSATSTESADQRAVLLQSPVYRPVSPQLVLRPDGIRKKNARFEIPKERNLQTIDALIQASTDENEKKELKQQKRLLRNRQAALDSRQRKKSHTEKLEHEKKISEKRMVDLKDAYAEMSDRLVMEREQWVHQRQQYEIQAKQLMHDRDEIIRQKTVEAADYRRQVNALKDYIREHHLERSQRTTGYAPASEMNNMASEFSEFNFDEGWDDSEFSLIGADEYKMDELDSMQRQATPKPPTSDKTTVVDATMNMDKNFSWNAFYMCLLFGAVVISAGEQLSKLAPKSSQISSLPKITEEYRADAANVLKAVMDTDPASSHQIIPSRSGALIPSNNDIGTGEFHYSTQKPGRESYLDRLSTTLTTPSRQQHLQQVFSMTPASYNHIADPLGDLDDDDADADLPDSPKPTRLEQAIAALQARQAETEKSTGLRSKADERSVLLDNVPEKVILDFKEFVRQSKALE